MKRIIRLFLIGTIIIVSSCKNEDPPEPSNNSTTNNTTTQPLQLTLAITKTDASSFGAIDGSVDLTVSGGTNPYTYLWSNGDTTEDISGLAAGVFSVTVTDTDAISIVGSVTINEPGPLPYAGYWGCWTEATGKPGVYDMILIEDTISLHSVELVTSCTSGTVGPAQNIGFFRNDTLILDNGIYEFWCFIENDTLLYSAYAPSIAIEKFIKI